MSRLSSKSKNNASFRFFAVEKGRISKRVPGREKTGIQFRNLWGRNSPRLLYFLRRDFGIHYSGQNLDSGLFRVVQYRASNQVDLREKTGMTVVRVGLNGFAVDIYSCARKTGTDNQIAVSAKWFICNCRGLFGSQSLFCSVFLFALSPTKFFSWQGN